MDIKKIFIFVMFFSVFNICFFATQANAIPCKDSNNQNVNVQGFSTALVYCVKNSIQNAITRTNGTEGYLPTFSKFMNSFMWAAVMLTIGLFGVKLVTMGVDQVLKEGAELIFRIAIVATLVLGASYFYVTALQIMGVLIGFVSGGFAGAGDIPTCSFGGAGTLLSSLPADAKPTEFLAWVKVDCMMQGMIGLSTNPATIMLGMAFIIGAALFSGTFGIAVVIAAVIALITALITIGRAIYVFILSYFVVGLLMVMTPLFAPLLLFDNGYTREFFWKWVSQILSYMLQPMFLIAFLSFAVMVQDQFINKNIAGCVPETFGAGGVPSSLGSGICSFKDLLDKNPEKATGKTIRFSYRN
jgi:type IV secretion system protein VirB6